MNIQYLAQLYRHKKSNIYSGFTLIELLVVVLIIGVLSAVALPNLISQIGKARETEALSNLGTMSRSQQGYHFENRIFADTLDKLASSVSFDGEYYNYLDADVATDTVVRQRATSVDSDANQTKDYAIGVYFNAGEYSFILCRSSSVDSIVEAPVASGGSCSNNGEEIQ